MKKIKNILTAAILTAGGFLAGCTSVADELTELSLTRCLEPLNLEYTISNGDSVIFNWDLVSGSDQFALQIAENDGTFETEDGKLTSAVIKDLIVTADKVPYGIKLTADQKYFFRVQAQTSANDKEPSKWAVSADTISTYAVRSSLFPEVTGRTSSSITISWNEDPEVTHILCTPREGTPVRYDLTDEDIKAHTATVDGLTPSTNYTVILYYMSASRGELSLYTMPDLSGIATVSTVEDLKQAFTDGAPKIVVSMAGSPYELGSVDLTKNMELYGQEDADGTRPVIMGTVSVNGTIDHFRCEGIEWNGNGYEIGRPIQIKDATTTSINEVIFKNCTITGFENGIFYSSDKVTNSDVGTLTFEGCDIYDIPGSGGDGIDIRDIDNKEVVKFGNINFINNTVYNSFRTFMRIDEYVNITGKITVRNNTIMGVSTFDNSNNRGIIGIQATSAAGKIEFSSNLFLHMETVSTMSSHNKNLPISSFTFSNNHFFDVNEEFFNDQCTEANAIAGGGSVLAADPCFNSAGMNFHLTNSTLLNAKVGDPRWLIAYVEPPIDNNLTLITGAKTWDLTDASIFSGSIKTTQVKDQLRIIADDAHEVILADSLVFTAAADISRAGIPNAGALEFLVDKPGSLVIETLDYDGNTGNHIVVSLNGTVKGGVATNSDMRGTSQKIVIEGIEEQSSIYLYPSGPIAITTLSWSNDVSPVNTALQTPEVTATPNSVGETAEPVTVTWNAVPGAASYSFSFGSISTEVTGTEYTIPADAFSVLGSGGYPVTVIANPAEGDIYNTASSAGTATISVVKGSSGPVTVNNLTDAFEYLNAGQPVQLAAGIYDLTSASGIDGLDNGEYTITKDFALSAANGADVEIKGYFMLGSSDNAKVEISGIKLTSSKSDKNLFETTATTVVSSIDVSDCEISGYKGLVYVSIAGSAIGDVTFDNNIISGLGNGQAAIDIRVDCNLTSVTFTNSTLYNSCREVFRIDDKNIPLETVTVTNCTFSDIKGSNDKGFFYIRENVLSKYTVKDNIFMNMPGTADKNYPMLHKDTWKKDNNKGSFEHSNNFYYNIGEGWFTTDFPETGAGTVLEHSPVSNSDNGDFTVTDATVKAAGAGDPRWL